MGLNCCSHFEKRRKLQLKTSVQDQKGRFLCKIFPPEKKHIALFFVGMVTRRLLNPTQILQKTNFFRIIFIMKINTPKTILWDFDGTLVDTINLVFFALKHTFLYCDDQNLTENDIQKFLGPPEDEIIKQYFIHKEQIDKGIAFYHQLYETFHDSFAICHKKVFTVVAALSSEGKEQAIVTGKGRQSLAISLEKTHLTGFFSTAITGNDILHPKPDPESLLAALQKLGVNPCNAVMIGDSAADYEAATSIGIPCIIVGWYRSPNFNGSYQFFHDAESLFVFLTGKHHPSYHPLAFPQPQAHEQNR